VTSVPLSEIRPSFGVKNPVIRLSVVVLPAPFGPIRPTISPGSTSRVQPVNGDDTTEPFLDVVD